MKPPFIITVDGPAASGKGTIAHRLGALYDVPVLDSGLLYRAVGVLTRRAGKDLDSEQDAGAVAMTLTAAMLDDPEFRTRNAGECASRVAVHSAVRLALRDLQLAFARTPGGAVLDGRDMGTVICPEAPAKLYVTASPQVRAQRRWKQLTAQGEAVSLPEILEDIAKRDARDGGRADSPMVAAPDAVLLDTTQMTIEQATDAARRTVEAARARWETS